MRQTRRSRGLAFVCVGDSETLLVGPGFPATHFFLVKARLPYPLTTQSHYFVHITGYNDCNSGVAQINTPIERSKETLPAIANV